MYHGSTISCLAYADDLVIIARSAHALQKLLDQASDGATILGLSFQLDKCASLSLVTDGRATVQTAVTDFTSQGEHFPGLENEESYRYLGVPIGLIHNIDDLLTISSLGSMLVAWPSRTPLLNPISNLLCRLSKFSPPRTLPFLTLRRRS